MAAEFTVAEIREKYPTPMVVFNGAKSPKHPDCYCVGGAFYQFHMHRRRPGLKTVPGLVRFPTIGELSMELCDANPHLTRGYACILSEKLTQYNDNGQFDQAWVYLGMALRFGHD